MFKNPSSFYGSRLLSSSPEGPIPASIVSTQPGCVLGGFNLGTLFSYCGWAHARCGIAQAVLPLVWGWPFRCPLPPSEFPVCSCGFGLGIMWWLYSMQKQLGVRDCNQLTSGVSSFNWPRQMGDTLMRKECCGLNCIPSREPSEIFTKRSR